MRFAGYADGSDSQGIIIFASDFHLHALNRSKVWLTDGTFKMPPNIFHQLYVIHALESVDSKAYPCVYALMCDKHTNSYRKLFEKVKQMCNAGPEIVILDLEQAPMNMIRTFWPDTILEACEFHVKKAMKEQLGKKGCLVAYNSNRRLQFIVNMFRMLMYCPADEIATVYESEVEPLIRQAVSVDSSDFVDDDDDEVDEDEIYHSKHDNTKIPAELIKYFEYLEKYYIGEVNPRTGRRRQPVYPTHIWSKYNAVLAGRFRTSNAAEQWHSAIQASLDKLGSNWKFVSWLSQKEMLKKEEHRRNMIRTNLDIPEAPGVGGHRKALNKMHYEKLQNTVKLFGVMNMTEWLESLVDLFKKKKRLTMD